MMKLQIKNIYKLKINKMKNDLILVSSQSTNNDKEMIMTCNIVHL